ncbi:MAG: aldolase/citrate lyase family protein [Pseudomonadota bacterium]
MRDVRSGGFLLAAGHRCYQSFDIMKKHQGEGAQMTEQADASAQTTLRHRVMAGELVKGAMIFEFVSPGLPQILAHAGCAYALYDMEHTGLSFETIKMQTALCRGLPVAPMVRVPRGDYPFIARALDCGCEGVMVPMVESVAQAEAIVEASRYPPRGRRGAAFGFAHDHYAGGAPQQKIEHADARNLIIAQIETERGLAEVDAIAAVEGIDVLWVGHFDLSNFLGVPGQFDAPVFNEAVTQVVEAGRRHGKGLGFLATDATWMADFRARGFNMMAAGTDMGLLIEGIRGVLKPLEDEA